MDTLSQMLQYKTMTLLEGKNLAKGTVKCLKGLQNENMFNLFYQKVLLQKNLLAYKLKLLHRICNVRNYFQVQYNVQMDRLESNLVTF